MEWLLRRTKSARTNRGKKGSEDAIVCEYSFEVDEEFAFEAQGLTSEDAPTTWIRPPPLVIPDISQGVSHHKRTSTCSCSSESNEELGTATLQLSNLSPLRILGQGSFGSAVLVEDVISGKRLVLKAVVKGDSQASATERNILSILQHPFVVGFIGAMQDTDRLYYALEFCCGGDLGQLLGKFGCFTWKATQFFAAEIAMAIEFVHSRKIAIRDLKPENILMDSHGHVRLTDFGLSKLQVKGWTFGAKTLCGTEPYVAPEVYHWETYGLACDLWALGMMIFEMLTGGDFLTMQSACKSRTGVDAVTWHMTRFLVQLRRKRLRASLSVVRGLLERSPYRRLGANGFAEVRGHSFFRDLPQPWGAEQMLISGAPFKPVTIHEEEPFVEPRGGRSDKEIREAVEAWGLSKCKPSDQVSVSKDCRNEQFEGFTPQNSGSPIHRYLNSLARRSLPKNAGRASSFSSLDTSTFLGASSS